ncbi:hypothetical protein NQ176_g2990 [Zarea fungicola]|uniref:Uncharacterized protein n=1 Tax=Zarea fungicola TaxID=93591 RepID=A0ACC1NLS6_9HYPO|nr:hypothetical protein NQ176_g2990 [Lecanicillium fungicola]
MSETAEQPAPQRSPEPRSSSVLLSHISLGVSSYDQSRQFYNAVLATIGGSCVYDSAKTRTLGYGLASTPHLEALNLFEVQGAMGFGPGVHLAFNAPSRQAVVDFWEVAMSDGGYDEGKWGLRKDYGDNYYAAFVRDPDGHKLEAVFQGSE